jgi:hypothetical protein
MVSSSSEIVLDAVFLQSPKTLKSVLLKKTLHRHLGQQFVNCADYPPLSFKGLLVMLNEVSIPLLRRLDPKKPAPIVRDCTPRVNENHKAQNNLSSFKQIL